MPWFIKSNHKRNERWTPLGENENIKASWMARVKKRHHGKQARQRKIVPKPSKMVTFRSIEKKWALQENWLQSIFNHKILEKRIGQQRNPRCFVETASCTRSKAFWRVDSLGGKALLQRHRSRMTSPMATTRGPQLNFTTAEKNTNVNGNYARPPIEFYNSREEYQFFLFTLVDLIYIKKRYESKGRRIWDPQTSKANDGDSRFVLPFHDARCSHVRKVRIVE